MTETNDHRQVGALPRGFAINATRMTPALSALAVLSRRTGRVSRWRLSTSKSSSPPAYRPTSHSCAGTRRFTPMTDSTSWASLKTCASHSTSQVPPIPQLDARGSVWGYQYRPDTPRIDARGKPIKYESQTRGKGRRRGLDIHLSVSPTSATPRKRNGSSRAA